VARLRERRATITTAESVTGGLVARMLCEVPGASEVFRGGLVTYSDAWKRDALGVPAALLEEHGAVSEAVARAMAEGARRRSGADLAVATTGVAGPGPDDRGVPAGTVHVAVASAARTAHALLRIPLSRLGVQRRAAVAALDRARRDLSAGA
jgi:nicotinamide-nucleotide amidase